MLPVGMVLPGGFNGKIIWDFWGSWNGAESRIHVVSNGGTEERRLEDSACSSDSQELLDASLADYRSGLPYYLGWSLLDT